MVSEFAGFGGMALEMILTHRANGVTSISQICMVSVPLVHPVGWLAIHAPFSLQLRDAVEVALGILGRRPIAGIDGGVCRPVADYMTEYLVYRIG